MSAQLEASKPAPQVAAEESVICRPSQHNQPSRLIGVAALRFTRQSLLFEIALVFVSFHHIASVIVNANHGGVSPHPTHYSGVG